MPLALAVCQPTPSGDAALNGAVVRRTMREAAAAGARLAHFPEGFLSGYAVEDVASWDDVDWAVVGRELEAVAALAAELRLWVVLGSAHPLTPPHRPLNSLYVVSDTGRVVGRYDKRRLSHTEVTRFYTPGLAPLVVEVDGFRLGAALCIEVNFPDLFAEYERLGVDGVLLSAFPVDGVLATKAQAHAGIHGFWVSLSAPDRTAHLLASQLVRPDGTVLAAVEGGAGFVVGVLDEDDPVARRAREVVRPWRARAREGLIYEAARVVDDPRAAQ